MAGHGLVGVRPRRHGHAQSSRCARDLRRIGRQGRCAETVAGGPERPGQSAFTGVAGDRADARRRPGSPCGASLGGLATDHRGPARPRRRPVSLARLPTRRLRGRHPSTSESLSTLAHLAHRWGMPTDAGLHLPVAIGHRTIAEIVGARRPSVTVALGRLQRRGEARRSTARGWSATGPKTAPLILCAVRFAGEHGRATITANGGSGKREPRADVHRWGGDDDRMSVAQSRGQQLLAPLLRHRCRSRLGGALPAHYLLLRSPPHCVMPCTPPPRRWWTPPECASALACAGRAARHCHGMPLKPDVAGAEEPDGLECAVFEVRATEEPPPADDRHLIGHPGGVRRDDSASGQRVLDRAQQGLLILVRLGPVADDDRPPANGGQQRRPAWVALDLGFARLWPRAPRSPVWRRRRGRACTRTRMLPFQDRLLSGGSSSDPEHDRIPRTTMTAATVPAHVHRTM